MNTLSFKLTALALVGLLAADMASAQAAPDNAMYAVTYNAGVVSDYRFRGISQTSKGAAAQAGLDVTLKNGGYVGAWATNVKWVRSFNGASKGQLELDVYGGYKGELAQNLTYDVGAIAYIYPGNDLGAAGTLGAGSYTNATTKEGYGALTFGIYTVKYSRSIGTFLGFLDSAGSSYLDVSAAIDLGSGMTLTPHAGHQTVTGTTPGSTATNQAVYGYTDYALTLAKDMGKGLTLTAAATTTNAKAGSYAEYAAFGGKTISNSAFIVGAKYNF